MRAVDRGDPCAVVHRTLRPLPQNEPAATTQLLVELLLEALAQQVQGKGVETGVGEGQDTGHDTAHKVNQGCVHLREKI